MECKFLKSLQNIRGANANWLQAIWQSYKTRAEMGNTVAVCVNQETMRRGSVNLSCERLSMGVARSLKACQSKEMYSCQSKQKRMCAWYVYHPPVVPAICAEPRILPPPPSVYLIPTAGCLDDPALPTGRPCLAGVAIRCGRSHQQLSRPCSSQTPLPPPCPPQKPTARRTRSPRPSASG